MVASILSNMSIFLFFFFFCPNLEKADTDGNGTLDIEEFVTMAVHLKRIETNDELLGQAFVHFDRDKSGYIEFEDLQESMTEEHLGPNNDQVVQDIIFDADLNKVSHYKDYTHIKSLKMIISGLRLSQPHKDSSKQQQMTITIILELIFLTGWENQLR